jgi:hypothetical protein
MRNCWILRCRTERLPCRWFAAAPLACRSFTTAVWQDEGALHHQIGAHKQRQPYASAAYVDPKEIANAAKKEGLSEEL